MSPEQLEGRAVDHRTDIFALGIILYEMATGQRPFNASSGAGLMAAILSSEPTPIRTLQPALPAALERITMAALEKNPEERWQTAHDVARQLRWLRDGLSAEQVQAPALHVAQRAPLLLPLVVGGIAAALLTWGLMRFLQPPADQGNITRLHLVSQPDVTLFSNTDLASFALSPDGRTLCFVGLKSGELALYLRNLDSFDLRRLEGTEGANGPFWSSDGKWVAFHAREKLWKIQVSGKTPPEPVCSVPVGAIGTWKDRTILFSEAGAGSAKGIFRVSDSGGTPKRVTSPTGKYRSYRLPYFLPDGEHFLCQAVSANSTDRDAVIASLDGSNPVVLARDVSQMRAIGNDQLAYVRDGKLLAHRYDAAKRALIGEPVAVAEDLYFFYITGWANFDATPSGAVVYRTNTPTGRLSMVNRKGVERNAFEEKGTFLDASLSRDGRTAAVTILSPMTGLGDIWFYDLVRLVRERFTSEPGMEYSPLWARDGLSIFYSSAQGTLPFVVRRLIGQTADEQITAPGTHRYAQSSSPDGETLYVVERNSPTNMDILRVSPRTKQSVPLLSSSFNEGEPQVSPDGQWLAYSSDASGGSEVYLRSLSAETAGAIRLSILGGSNPQWSADGKELFFVSKGRTIMVARSLSGRWNDSTAEELFAARQNLNDYAPLPDGQTFLLLESTPGPKDSLFHVILGWR